MRRICAEAASSPAARTAAAISSKGRSASPEEPDLDRVGPLRGQVARPLARGLLVGEIDELPLAGQVQPVVARRKQRTGRGHVGGQGVGLRPLAQRPGPGIAAHVEHRRDPGAEVGPEEALGMGAQAGLHRVVREVRAQIQAVGAPIGPARLGEVDVRIHEAGGQPEARDVQGRDPRGNGALCPRARAVDRPSAHQHHRIGHRGAAASIHERGPHQGTRRRGRPRRGHEPGGHRDLPAFRGLEEQALGDPLVLLLAHEGAHAIGPVDEAGADADELQVLGLEGVGPASLGASPRPATRSRAASLRSPSGRGSGLFR